MPLHQPGRVHEGRPVPEQPLWTLTPSDTLCPTQDALADGSTWHLPGPHCILCCFYSLCHQPRMSPDLALPLLEDDPNTQVGTEPSLYMWSPG